MENLNHVKKILVRAPNWIGDAVMCTPALAALRSRFPGAEMTLLANRATAELLRGLPDLDRILVYDKTGPHRGFAGKRRLVRDLRLEFFDLAVLFQNAFEAALLAWLVRIPLRCGYRTDARGFLLTTSMAPPRPPIHQAIYYLNLLRLLGIGWDSARLDLRTTEQEDQAARQLIRDHGLDDGGPLVGINPGATYGAAKQWGAAGFSAVADRLIEAKKCRVIIFGGPGEQRLGQEISDRMKHPAAVLSGRLSIRALMATVRQCALFITNDSGPMHIAAAFGVPIVAIFGPTDPGKTAPIADRALVVKRPILCAPCFLRECPIDHQCMRQIDPDEVFDAASHLLKSAVPVGIQPVRINSSSASFESSRGIAVFLDRDGTINEDVGYLDDPGRIHLVPGAVEALRRFNQEGLKTAVLTNQSGVDRGYYTEERLGEIHQRLKGLLAEQGARLDAVYYCKHHPDEACGCRKPAPGMLRQAARDLSVDLGQCYVVGDKQSDIEMAWRSGAKGVLVLTGQGMNELARIRSSRPHYVARDLQDAAAWILEDIKRRKSLQSVGGAVPG